VILIRFSDAQAECRALGYLAGRFPFKSWSTGETLVAEAALPHLAVEGIPFSVLGPANYEQRVPAIRAAAASPVQ
jgi:hypothetical protein